MNWKSKMLRGLCALGAALMFSMSGFVTTAQAEEQPPFIRVVMGMDVKDDDHVVNEITFLVKKENADKLGLSASKICSLTKSGTANGGTEIEESGYVGCRSKQEMPLSKVSGLRHEDGKYFLDIKAGSTQSGIDLAKTSKMIESMEIHATFPGKVIAHGGDAKVEGNTVTWTNTGDIISGKATATAKDGASSLLWLWALLGVLALAAIAAAIFYVLNGKKKAAAQQHVNLQHQMPQYTTPGAAPRTQDTEQPRQ